MSEQAATLTAVVASRGYRLTAARKAIIEALVSCEGHISADDLAALARRKEPRVGRMTVYRTLDLLCDLGVLRPIYQGTGAAHYILLGDGSHHHFICNQCHAVIEFDDCSAGDLIQQLAVRFDFQVQSHLMEVYGLCANCQM
jgi:Fur family ferric uptake transcriptional regulator